MFGKMGAIGAGLEATRMSSLVRRCDEKLAFEKNLDDYKLDLHDQELVRSAKCKLELINEDLRHFESRGQEGKPSDWLDLRLQALLETQVVVQENQNALQQLRSVIKVLGQFIQYHQDLLVEHAGKHQLGQLKIYYNRLTELCLRAASSPGCTTISLDKALA